MISFDLVTLIILQTNKVYHIKKPRFLQGF
jgi:hypothetical protein